MSMFTGCPIIKNETMVDVDTITAYIRTLAAWRGKNTPIRAGRGGLRSADGR